MKRELLINPILIPTVNSDWIEYVYYIKGRRTIYVVKSQDKHYLPIFGTSSASGYRPKEEVTYKTLDRISSKDERLKVISRELAKKYKFWFQFLRSNFRNAKIYSFYPLPYSTPKTAKEALALYENARGIVSFYLFSFAREVKFGPLVKIHTEFERTRDVDDFIEELRPRVEDLYGIANIFQTHDKGRRIMRKL